MEQGLTVLELVMWDAADLHVSGLSLVLIACTEISAAGMVLAMTYAKVFTSLQDVMGRSRWIARDAV